MTTGFQTQQPKLKRVEYKTLELAREGAIAAMCEALGAGHQLEQWDGERPGTITELRTTVEVTWLQ